MNGQAPIFWARSLWIILIFNVASNLPLYAQSIELGGFSGISNYHGEIQETMFEPSEAQMVVGLFSRLNLNKSIGLKMHYYQGDVTGSDLRMSAGQLISRNLSFRTSIKEIGVQAELALVTFGMKKTHPTAKSYIFGGIAAFYFNPMANLNGEWVDLQPLGTEGQGMEGYAKPYNRLAVSYPFGLGFKVNLSKYAAVGVELGVRKTNTDYLDDVSTIYPDIFELEQHNPMAARLSYREPEITGTPGNPMGQARGNPMTKDWYMFCGITFSAYLYRHSWH